MKTIAPEFTRDGFNYKQIWRQNDVAVYEYGCPGRYEVIVIKREPACISPNGGTFPERERYPRSHQWGQYGWTLTDREIALEVGQVLSETRSRDRVSAARKTMDRLFVAKRRASRGIGSLPVEHTLAQKRAFDALAA